MEAKHYEKHLHSFVAHCAKEWPADQDIFTDPVLEPMFEAEFAAAFEQGGVGALDDMWGFLDWGFAPEDVDPTRRDVRGRRRRHPRSRRCRRASRSACPTRRSHTWPGAGHYGVYGRWPEFLSAIL